MKHDTWIIRIVWLNIVSIRLECVFVESNRCCSQKKKNKSIFQNIRSCYNGVHRMTMATWVRVSKKFAKISRACIIPLAISYLFIHIPDFDARSSHFAITLLDILHKMHPKRSTSNRVVCVWVCSRPTVEYLIMFSWKIK